MRLVEKITAFVILNFFHGIHDEVRQNSQFDSSTFVVGSNSFLNYEIDQSSPQTFYLGLISFLDLCGMPCQQ